MSSAYGKNIKVSIFGQSHSKAIGVTVDGFPAGKKVDLDELNAFMGRRAPGQNAYSTSRQEKDHPEILSGLVDGITCGAPFSAVIYNTDAKSDDYREIRDIPRPAHADYTAHIKYGGYQDVAGGGHFSARLTAPLCIAGGICLQFLKEQGITIAAHIHSIGEVYDTPFDPVNVSGEELEALLQKNFPTVSDEAGEAMIEEIAAAKADLDSIGGVVECVVHGLPVGLGDPMFDGMENRIASIVFGIPAVKGLEFGSGFASSHLRGSQNNDSFYMDGDTVKTRTNHHGGILGGITSGMPLIFRAGFKPTPSIGREQQSISLSEGKDAILEVKGRHDPCIVPRAVPVVEAAAAIAVYDALLESQIK